MFNRAALVVLLVLLQNIQSAPIFAQTPSRQALVVDVFGGFVGGPLAESIAPVQSEDEAQQPSLVGWEVGSSLRLLKPWLGVVGSYGQRGYADGSMREILTGVRFTTPWFIGGEGVARYFAHALGGYSHERILETTDSGPALVLGGGFDLLAFRFQVDYLRHSLSIAPRDTVRVFVGGMIPFCFRTCVQDKGNVIDLSGGR
jgi:hypothetical protein